MRRVPMRIPDVYRAEADDDTDSCGSPLHYTIDAFANKCWNKWTTLHFQNDDKVSVETEMVNGVSDEVILSILIDRLKHRKETTSEAGRANSLTVTKLEEALHWLQSK